MAAESDNPGRPAITDSGIESTPEGTGMFLDYTVDPNNPQHQKFIQALIEVLEEEFDTTVTAEILTEQPTPPQNPETN